MEVGQGPNRGCNAEEKKTFLRAALLYLRRYYVSLCYTGHLTKFGKVQTRKYVLKLSLYLIKQYSMKRCWKAKVSLHTILSSTLDGSEWSLSCPGRPTYREDVPSTH
jgi:hypothetical protein